jgi:hypothetical protein
VYKELNCSQVFRKEDQENSGYSLSSDTQVQHYTVCRLQLQDLKAVSNAEK